MERRDFLKTAAGISAAVLAGIGSTAKAAEAGTATGSKIYKCSVCGNIVEVLHESTGKLRCCRTPMMLLEEQTQGKGSEKHVPVIEKTEKGIKVKVGAKPHPMTEDHHIEWIEILADGKVCRRLLKPGDTPEAVFAVTADDISARAYCNLHDLWRS